MKDLQKFGINLVFIILLIVTIIAFFARGTTLKDIPIIESIVFVSMLILVMLLSRHKMHNIPLQKKRRTMLIVLIALVVLLLIQVVRDITPIQKGYLPFWRYIVSYFLSISIIAIFSYILSRKDKKQKTEK